MDESLRKGLTDPPETSHVRHVRALRQRSETARLKKVTRASQVWERVITRKPKEFKTRTSEKIDGTVLQFARLVAHAIDHQYKRLRQRRNAANYAIELAQHNGAPANQLMKPRQLSRQWRRIYKRRTP